MDSTTIEMLKSVCQYKPNSGFQNPLNNCTLNGLFFSVTDKIFKKYQLAIYHIFNLIYNRRVRLGIDSQNDIWYISQKSKTIYWLLEVVLYSFFHWNKIFLFRQTSQPRKVFVIYQRFSITKISTWYCIKIHTFVTGRNGCKVCIPCTRNCETFIE